jgi:type IV pilus assembly protein PilO
MATKAIKINFDLAASLRQGVEQFNNLDPKEPGQWPMLPKVLVWAVAACVVVVVAWFVLLSDEASKLDAARAKEPQLKTEYRSKLAQAVNLGELRKQKEQVQEYVTQLEKQLPGKAEMDALLSDINQAGVGRGLQFELFRPGQVVVKDYYAELPIAIKVSGRFHDIGAFAADVANLSRIVTLHNLIIVPPPKDNSGALSMEATARTYRYLDPAEVAEVKRAAAAARSGKAGNKAAAAKKEKP